MILESVFKASESTAMCRNQKQTNLNRGSSSRSLCFLHFLCSTFFVEQENDQKVDSRRGRGIGFMSTEYLWSTEQRWALCTSPPLIVWATPTPWSGNYSTDEITEIPGVRGTCPGSRHKWQTEFKFSLSLAPKPWVLALSHMFCFR